MNQMVYVVDDDDSVRNSLIQLLRSEDYDVADFSSPQDFLSHPIYPAPCCLILDINMPNLDGLNVNRTLHQRGYSIPTIFLTGFGTIPVTVKAMKEGAYEFLTKPADPEEILNSVSKALHISQENMVSSIEKLDLTVRHQSLTPRESEVMLLAIGGLLNKQIAHEMGVSEITAKVHKRRVMEKMQARSLSDLVRAAERLNLGKSRSR
ncbi:response regulator [Pantoea sp. LMR881]|uniref:response regulator transcription factor n=1 Tax=Pantoea sp. LMR881 TaxID=3014336 RepID=UPI0022AFE1F5|nr:response regulator [Pantoea sp. LMR881]MCZ4061392.1 response regulator [Pantoea sp. LMR881]MCZ4061465.1 response regulator [Pantoea sp. LMR881]